VVHEVRPARNGARLDRQRLDLVDAGFRRRRRDRSGRPLVEVVEQTYAHSALSGRTQCAEDDLLRLVVEVDVVDRDVERPFGALEEGREQARDLDRPLSAVFECSDLDQA
jgi:Mg-chelatase subunit ChlI